MDKEFKQWWNEVFLKTFSGLPKPIMESFKEVAEQAWIAAIQANQENVERLTDILVNVTHHDGAVEEYKSQWLPVVQSELDRRHKLFYGDKS